MEFGTYGIFKLVTGKKRRPFLALKETIAPEETTASTVSLTSRVKWFNHLHGYEFTPAVDRSCVYIINRKGILSTASTTSPATPRNGEVVSFTVEKGRNVVEAVNMARFNYGWILGSLDTHGRRTTDIPKP